MGPSPSGPCRLFRRATKIAARTLNPSGRQPQPSSQKIKRRLPCIAGEGGVATGGGTRDTTGPQGRWVPIDGWTACLGTEGN